MATVDYFPVGESMETFEASVRQTAYFLWEQTAYFLWEQDGRPEGNPDEYWRRALESKIRERSFDSHLAQSGPDPAQS